jgi:diadenosine tetraphosphate (Ap4A) HIT family hydrolase
VSQFWFCGKVIAKDKYGHVLNNDRPNWVENMADCLFCKIAAGVVPASVVYSDGKVMAFLDAQPVNTGHVLVIPRAHARELSELDPEVGGQMFKVAMVVAEGLKGSGLKCEGVDLILGDKWAVSRLFPHVHLHVIPRFKGDGFEQEYGPNYGIKPGRKELDTIAEQIRRVIHK